MSRRARTTVAWIVASVVALGLIGGPAIEAAPLSEADLGKLIELEVGDAAIVAKLAKDGVQFALDDELLDRLKQAGASTDVLAAVRKAGARPAGGGPKKPKAVSYQDVLEMLRLKLDEEVILKRIGQSPTLFVLGEEQASELQQAGATQKILDALAGRRQPDEQAGDITDFAIILDCSGSMKELTGEGQPKMEVAKQVVTDLVRSIPDGLNLTFVIYGHDKKLECQAVKIARPLGVLDKAGKDELASFIATLKPVYSTPIALALKKAGEELAKNDARCGMVLISDGKESCKGDPAAEAARLVNQLKLSFGINVVGFDVKQDERASLEQIADAGHGKYYHAESAGALAMVLQTLQKNIQKAAKPTLEDREKKKFAAAGKKAQPGAFLHDAPVVEPDEYQGALAMMEAHYYQVPVRKGQELRAIAVVQKTPFRAGNDNNSQSFSVTIYDQNLAVVARQATDVPGKPTTPATFKATWTALADQLAYVAVAASGPRDGGGSPSSVYPEGTKVEPSKYTLRLRLVGDAAGAETPLAPVARQEVTPGAGFDEAGELSVPGLVATDIKQGEVLFFRVQAQKGEVLQFSLGAQKPSYRVSNEGPTVNRATYTLTLYDEDQVQTSQHKLDAEGYLPDAYSTAVACPMESSGPVYFSISCDNTGYDVYPKDAVVPPGHLVVQVTRQGEGDAAPVEK